MSVPTKEQIIAFLEPLRGGVTILVLHEAQAREPLAKLLLACARLQAMKTTILDSDAYYSSNAAIFADDLRSCATGELLLFQGRNLELECLLPLLSSGRELIIIDDLNSLYSLATGVRRLHHLNTFIRLLSHNARTDHSWVVATAYRAQSAQQQGKNAPRSLDQLADVTLDVDYRDGSVAFKPVTPTTGNAAAYLAK